MPKVLLSTLIYIQDEASINQRDRTLFANKFNQDIKKISGLKLDEDSLVDITENDKKWLDKLCMNISYPHCISCRRPICGSGSNLSRCSCENKRLGKEFQTEYRILYKEIEQAENALQKLQQSPFRQLRNAYGFSTGIFGGVNLILNMIPSAIMLSTGVVAGLATLPAVVLGVYVYVRGYREEKKINDDTQADLLDKKIKLMSAHKQSVSKRFQCINTLQYDDFLNKPAPKTKQKRAKEKRSVWGNPLAHGVITSLATMGLIYFFIAKFALITLLGGPATWAIAASIAVLVGAYFIYKRYSYLDAKMRSDKAINILEARKSDILELTKKCEPQPIFSLRQSNNIDDPNEALANIHCDKHRLSSSNARIQITDDLRIITPIKPAALPLLIRDQDNKFTTKPKISLFFKDTNNESHYKFREVCRFNQYFNQAVNQYLNELVTNNHLNIISRNFDENRGKIRAKTYQKLFSNTHSIFQKMVVMYALFASEDGKTLQKKVYKKMGYLSLEAAKEDLINQIKSVLNFPSDINVLNDRVIGSIVSQANNKISFESGAYQPAMDMLITLEKNQKCEYRTDCSSEHLNNYVKIVK